MPVICVNPSNSSEKEIVEKLSLQNGDLRVFLSDQLEETFNKSIPGKNSVKLSSLHFPSNSFLS